MKRRGLILLNLGTPDSPEPQDVARYLTEFLMDPWVLDTPWILRWLLVHFLIVPKRKHDSGELYRTIWDAKRGSPLLYHLEDLALAVKAELAERGGPDSAGGFAAVEIAMRYGSPAIQPALERLQRIGCDEIVVFPLYPQYAESSTRTCQEACVTAARGLGIAPERLRFVKPFYGDARFTVPMAALVREYWLREKPDHLLLSFHSLPERHIEKTDRSGGRHCLKSADCCAEITAANVDCYRAQSYATARLIAEAAGIPRESYTVSFQSRLGRAAWIGPSTETTIPRLAREKGVRKLAVACPSFVADCLETVEEIGVRGQKLFIENGGETLVRIPCLNADAAWAAGVAGLATGA